jgi:hypothetical protein
MALFPVRASGVLNTGCSNGNGQLNTFILIFYMLHSLKLGCAK